MPPPPSPRPYTPAAVAHGEFYFTGGNGFLYHVHPDHPEDVRQLYDWKAPTAVAETLHVFHNDDRMLVSVFATSTVRGLTVRVG